MPGGDLMHKLISYGKLSEKTSKLYASELFLAIDFLHKNDIIFRDLKPDNILIDEIGHIKLTDFGLSKKFNCEIDNSINDSPNSQKSNKSHKITYSICGTPSYIAPEVYKGIGYSKEIDWWSFGIVIYEMLTGKFPFKRIGKGNKKIFNLDVNFELKSPLSNDAKDLIGKLLEKDINKRLTEPFDIMNHSFFKDVNWDDVYNKKILPEKNNFNDISNKSIEEQLNNNFDKQFIENKIEVEKIEGFQKKIHNNIERDDSLFQNFTFYEKEEIIA
jgi:protein-serine/threonine kinase